MAAISKAPTAAPRVEAIFIELSPWIRFFRPGLSRERTAAVEERA
jgi:hypothetical protein